MAPARDGDTRPAAATCPTSEALTRSGVGWAPSEPLGPESDPDEVDADSALDEDASEDEAASDDDDVPADEPPPTLRLNPVGRIPDGSSPLAAASWSTVVP